MASVLPSGGALVDKVIAHPITQPDLVVVLRVLEGLSMDGSPPFREMTSFRTKCFQSFPVSHVQRMTLSQVLGPQPINMWISSRRYAISPSAMRMCALTKLMASRWPSILRGQSVGCAGEKR